MKFVADLHFHSHYSRATSQDARPENLYRWAVYKGVTLVGTGDFTHPEWREELKDKLEPAEEGLYRLKEEFRRLAEESQEPGTRLAGLWSVESPYIHLDSSGRPLVRFIVSGEISAIYKKGGKVRKIHHLVFFPSFEAADEFSRRLEGIGNIRSDGRPIVGLDSRYLLEMALEVCSEALFIPAHIWTPHFSLFGANSGFDSMEECFGDLADYIYAVETGLSSDPPMNWRLSSLDRFVLVSNSDAHSPRNLAREANLFDTDLSYSAIYKALKDRDPARFLGTLEFFPEEGKYHYDGHRGCNIRWKPSQTRAAGGICPVCGRKVTVGVLHRVEELADREEGYRPKGARHFESLVPLPEVIASALGVGVSSRQVMRRYFSLIHKLGPELVVLREAPLGEIARVGGAPVAEAVRRVREGEVEVLPGFDGEYGKIILLRPQERQGFFQQATLFGETKKGAASPEIAATAAPPLSMVAGEATAVPSKVKEAPLRQPAPEDEGVLAGLNPGQWEAVTAENGPIMVIAGPGTGKTRTLVYRIAYLIGERGVAPQHITAVTFTNKAASEIRDRVMELLGDIHGIEFLTIGTFHSICLDVLKNHAAQNQSRLTVLDEADCREILKEILQGAGKSRPQNVLEIQRRISFLKSRGLLPSYPGVPEDLRPIFLAYQERLLYYRALDYDDILLESARVFEKATSALTRFTHLLVDEFQDVNPLQYTLVKLWAREGNNLFVIGDPNQAIYGFRGADHRFFWQLKKDFPQGRFLYLSQNYRSTPVILRAASAVVANNPEDKLLPVQKSELVATKRDGPRIQHLEVPDEFYEGMAVVGEIVRMVGGTTMLQAHGQGRKAIGKGSQVRERVWSFSDIAVLFRTGRQGETLEECFLKEGIPYRVVGRESFLEDRAVRETLAFFRCVVDPEDDFHLFRCLSGGSFGLSPEGVALVQDAVEQLGGPAWRAIAELTGGGPSPGPAAFKKLLAFKTAIETYRSLMGSEPPDRLLARWIEENNLGEMEAMKRLVRVASRFNDLPSFMRGIVLAQEADHERMGSNATSPEAVTLMTLHAAKGLEFPVVFITGVEDGLIPLRDRENPSPAEDALAEERRLFYVGMTRAMEELILVSARKRMRFGEKVPGKPSPFIREIPQECLESVFWEARPGRKKGGGGEKYTQLTLF
ncbi:MAG: hypothetical protein PWP65_876 [Clostridia bacterium]|nr:hypothetical protein [Clostridia bacterium]